MSKAAYKKYLVDLINQILYINLSEDCNFNDNYEFTNLVKMAKRVKDEIKKDTQTEELQ